MAFQPGANIYTQGFGSRPESVEVPHYDTRIPNVSDIGYPVGKRWVTSTGEYTLLSLSSIGGTTTANWSLLGTNSGALNTLTTDDLTVVTPVGGNINLAGASPLSTTGLGDTATLELGTVPVSKGGTGLTTITAHDVIIGNGTSAVTLVAPSATVGVPLVSAGAAADPVYGTAVVAGGGTGAVTLTGVLTGNGTSAVTANAVTNHCVVVGAAANAVGTITAGTNGQVLIGSTGADPAFATLSSTTNLTFTGGAGSLAVNVSKGGYTVTPVAGTSSALAAQNAYIANNAGATTFTLPATAAVGDMFLIVGDSVNAAGWIIAQNAAQTIYQGASASTTGVTGTVTSPAAKASSAILMCTATNTDFVVLNANGTLVFT